MTEETPIETRRGPGRPPQVKKGKPTWKPANVDDVFDREDGYRYRKILKDPDNLKKKEAEGWEIVSDVTGDGSQMQGGYGRIDDGKPLTSVKENRDSVLARMPEDVAQERDAFFNAKTARFMGGLKRQTQRDLGSDAPIHGSISIEKRGIRTVIKE